jgi:glycosyltransferase involved in cell wall biosynthesis
LEKKIAIVHHTLSSLGGGERVGVSTIEALNKAGIIPDVYTTSPIKLEYLRDFYGKKVKLRLHPIAPFSVRLFGIYQRLLSSFYSFRLANYDVVVNTTGIYTPLFFKSLVKRYILYVYNPLVPLQPFAVKENLKYQRSLFWKIYFQPYQNIIRRSIAKLNGTELLAVSEFTRWRIRKYWEKPSVTVYPPVDIESFSTVFDNKNRDGVISIGRFTPEKNHLLQLQIAKYLPEMTFRICGSAKTPYYQRWYQHVKAKAEEMDLKNAEFYPNITFKKLVDLIGESKFFLHTMTYEDFGLTTCEAIAGGCIPCVHDSGGQREVVPFSRLRFRTAREASKILSSNFPCSVRKDLYRHIQQYREENFQNQMLKVILHES